MVSDFAIEYSRPGMEPLKTGIGCWHEEACWHKILGVCRNWAICWQYEGYICINVWIWYFNFRLVVNVHFLLPKDEALCINRVNHSIQYEDVGMTWTLFHIAVEIILISSSRDDKLTTYLYAMQFIFIFRTSFVEAWSLIAAVTRNESKFIHHEWAKRTKSLGTVIYGSPRRHSNNSKTL